MTTPSVVLPVGLTTLEGMEAVLQVLLRCVQQKLPTYVAEVAAEWAAITGEATELLVPDNTSYRIINDFDTLPADEGDAYPFVVLLGFQDQVEEKIEQSGGDFYQYDIAVRVWIKGDDPQVLTKQNFRYAEAVKRTLHFYSRGAQNSANGETLVWVVWGLNGAYNSITPTSPYIIGSEVSAKFGVFRSW